jgi:hypothetical protein
MSMIGDEVIVFRLAIAAVFVTAALAKTMEAHGPTRSDSPLSNALLSAAELLTALALLSGRTARWGLIAATLLAVGFLATLAVRMSRGNTATCGCFGTLDREVSPLVSIFRASFLFALAAGGLAAGWHSANPDAWVWLSHLDPAHRAGTMLSVLAFAALVAVPGRVAHWLSRINDMAWGRSVSHMPRPPHADFPPAGPAVGSAAPQWPTLFTGERSGPPVILLFVDATNGSSLGHSFACDGKQSVRVSVARDSAIAQEYHVRALPSGVLVSATGVVLSRLAAGPAAIRRLCASGPDATRPIRTDVTSRLNNAAVATASGAAIASGCRSCGG